VSWERTLQVRTKSETNMREHWSARHKRRRAQRNAAWAVTCEPVVLGLATLPAVVTLTRIAPRRLDSDNLLGALKAIRDGVADALGVDDADPRLRWVYQQESGGKGRYGVRIALRSADEGEEGFAVSVA
jgi:hypothetical protein